MPRKKEFEQYESHVRAEIDAGKKPLEIFRGLKNRGVRGELRSFESRLQEWSIRIHRPTLRQIPGIELIIRDLVADGLCSDREILKILELEYPGYSIKHRTLWRLRSQDLQLTRRPTPEVREARKREILRLLDEEMKQGHLEDHGRRLMLAHMRRKYGGFINVGEKQLLDMAFELDPIGRQRKEARVKHRTGKYITPGPNYLWAADGHCKLEHWGIEIYGAIDAFSRYIIWLHIGASAKTAYGVMVDYLDIVLKKGFRPWILRTDKGTETRMLGNLHHALVGQDHPGIPIEKTYCYGTSTSNTKIESWWQQLTRTVVHRWRDYFSELEHDGTWEKGNIVDEITLLAIYGPMVKKEIEEFVKTWNVHTITVNKKKRPWVVPGRPYMLYYYPGTSKHTPAWDYACDVDRDKVQRLRDEVDKGPGRVSNCLVAIDNHHADTYGFLPPDMLALCHRLLHQRGLNLAEMSAGDYQLDGERTHHVWYRDLRSDLQAHLQSNAEPSLRRFKKPRQDGTDQPVAIKYSFGTGYSSDEGDSDDEDNESICDRIREIDLGFDEPDAWRIHGSTRPGGEQDIE